MNEQVQTRLAQLRSLETPVRVLEIPMNAAYADREISATGDILGAWLGPNAASEIGIRFNERSEPLIPFRQGMSLRVPFVRLFITNATPIAPPNIMYLVYGDANLISIQNNAADPGAVLAGILTQMTAVANNTAAILALTEPSDNGDSEVVTVPAASAAAGANRPCRQAYVWTAGATIHFKIGTTNADALDPILSADLLYPIDVANTQLLRFYNSGPGPLDVSIVWRN